MADETTNAPPPHRDRPEGRGSTPSQDVACDIPSCCIETIFEHVKYNPMMVCSGCKNIIKCFTEERAFQNYLTFCRSRRRTVLTGHVQHYWTVAFRSYDTFNR